MLCFLAGKQKKFVPNYQEEEKDDEKPCQIDNVRTGAAGGDYGVLYRVRQEGRDRRKRRRQNLQRGYKP
jgi:hypothetical protein